MLCGRGHISYLQKVWSVQEVVCVTFSIQPIDSFGSDSKIFTFAFPHLCISLTKRAGGETGRVVLTSQTRRVKIVSSRGPSHPSRSLLPGHTTAHCAHATATTEAGTARTCTAQCSRTHASVVGRSVERVVEQGIVVERGGVEHAHHRGATGGVDTVEGGQVRGDAAGDAVIETHGAILRDGVMLVTVVETTVPTAVLATSALGTRRCVTPGRRPTRQG
mmetsp:Transcript_9087/g.15547  ORF Transcript_9087/g.15547 Transcript_9087/m.15547 type:complete len:219 (+) Transcript_9087:265-921(+)